MTSKHVYVVSSFLICGRELKDVTKDISFLHMHGVFIDKLDAEKFAHELFLQEKNNPFSGYEYHTNRIICDIDGTIITYYLSSIEIEEDFQLTDLEGLVINVKSVKMDPQFVPNSSKDE